MSTSFHVDTSSSISGLFLVEQSGAGQSFPWSQLWAHRPHNKGSLWAAAGVGPGPSLQPLVVFSRHQAGLVSSGLNSEPPPPRDGNRIPAVVPVTHTWGACGKKKIPSTDKDLSQPLLLVVSRSRGHTWGKAHSCSACFMSLLTQWSHSVPRFLHGLHQRWNKLNVTDEAMYLYPPPFIFWGIYEASIFPWKLPNFSATLVSCFQK